MQTRDFAFWLQGFFEIQDAGKQQADIPEGLTPAQVKIIREHLALVFKHVSSTQAGTAPIPPSGDRPVVEGPRRFDFLRDFEPMVYC